MMFANLTPNQIRARGLAARLEGALLASLSALPDSTVALRNRIAAAARVRIISSPTVSVTIDGDWGHGSSSQTAAAAAMCRHTARELGYDLGALGSAQVERGRELRAEAARLSAASSLRRYFDLGTTRRATVAFYERALDGLEVLPVRSTDFDVVLATVATASGFAVDATGYRLLDASGRPSPVVTSFEELGSGLSIEDLRASSTETADEFEDTAELILALLSPAADGGVGDDVTAEASAAGLDLADYSHTVDPTLTADEDLVQRYRRRLWLERKLTPIRAAASTRESRPRDVGADAATPARLTASRIAEESALPDGTDDEWAEVWPELLGSQTALAVDFIDRQVPRVYGRPPVSFEAWARRRWALGEHNRLRLAEAYLDQLKPKSGRSVIRHYQSWAERKWIESSARRAVGTDVSGVQQAAWQAQTVTDRATKHRANGRRHALELGLLSAAEKRDPEEGLQLE